MDVLVSRVMGRINGLTLNQFLYQEPERGIFTVLLMP